MKTVIISTCLALVSLSAMAQPQPQPQRRVYGPQNNYPQQGGGSTTNGYYNNSVYHPQQVQPQPQPLPKKVIECMSAARPHLNLSENDLEWRCRDERTQKTVKEKLSNVTACIQTARNLQVKSFWPVNCLEEQYRGKLADSGYTSCLSAVKKTPFEYHDDQFCQDTEIRTLSSDSSLLMCYNYFDKDLKRTYGWQSIELCKSPEVRQKTVLKTYQDCHDDLKKYNVPMTDAMDYCGQPQPKVVDGLGRVKTCISEMTKIFGKFKGLEVCVRNLAIPEIASKENIACMNQTLRSTSPQFLDLLQGQEAAQFMRDLTFDCRRPAVQSNNKILRYLNTFFIASSERVGNQEIGGLSGIAYDAQTSQLLAISDQRFQGKNYIFKFEMNDIGQGFDVIPDDKILAIKPEYNDGKGTMRFDIDSEGIALDPNGNIVVSSESLTDNDRSYVKIFNPNGKQIEAIELPQKFYNFKLEQVTVQEPTHPRDDDENDQGDDQFDDSQGSVRVHRGNSGTGVTCYGNCPSYGNNGGSFGSNVYTLSAPVKSVPKDAVKSEPKPQTRTYVQRTYLNNQGVSDNKGFEALGMTKDGKTIFTANEAPLRQDRMRDHNIVRILKIEKVTEFEAVAEYLYRLEDGVDNGLVEILPISSTDILTLERGYDPQLRKVTARIFRVNLARAVDTLANESLFTKGFKIQPVKKELVIDLDSVIDSMPAGLRKLDNIEGMSFGPKTAQGSDTLLLVTDNNMTTKQRTFVMSFEILK